jgi:hypothetical protein
MFSGGTSVCGLPPGLSCFADDCSMGDVGLPVSLRGCTLEVEGKDEKYAFGKARLLTVEHKPTYWQYTPKEVWTEKGHRELIGELQFVPLGNAVGQFYCTIRHDLAKRDLTQTADFNVFRVSDTVSKETCTGARAARPETDVQVQPAVLRCPRDL